MAVGLQVVVCLFVNRENSFYGSASSKLVPFCVGSRRLCGKISWDKKWFVLKTRHSSKNNSKPTKTKLLASPMIFGFRQIIVPSVVCKKIAKMLIAKTRTYYKQNSNVQLNSKKTIRKMQTESPVLISFLPHSLNYRRVKSSIKVCQFH